MPGKPQSGLLRRRQFICGCCVALVGARMVPALAATPGDDPDNAPLARNEPHHHLLMQNDLVRIIRVLIPPGGSTLWHEHNFDYVVLAVNGTKVQVDVRGGAQGTAGVMAHKSLAFVSYAGKHFVHRVANPDTVANHQLAFELIPPTADGYGAGDRSAAPQYKMEIDNDRIRAWRLQLGPGEMTAMITQKAPAIRFVLSGERIVETDSQGQVKDTPVRSGDYAWLPGAQSRSLTNASTSPLEMVEIELK